MAHEVVDPIILDAVRDNLKVVSEQLSFFQEDVGAKQEALRKAEAARDQLADRCAKLADYLAAHGAPHPEEPPPPNSEGTASEREDPLAEHLPISAVTAVQIAKEILADGRQKKVPAIYAAMERSGYLLVAADPIRRLTQAKSASKLFEADRALGWRLLPPKTGGA